MKAYHLISIFIFTIISFCSCSVSKKIERAARQNMLLATPFSPAHTGIAIYDAVTGHPVYEYQADKFFVPASNTKIITCYAALRYLKDSVPALRYQTFADSAITIEPLGDPTFLHPDYPNQPAYQLLKKFKSIRLLKPKFGEYLGNGWAWNDYLYSYMPQKSSMPVYGNIAVAELVKGEIQFTPPYFNSLAYTSESIDSGFVINKSWDSNEFQLFAGKRKRAEIPFVPNLQTLTALLEDTLGTTIHITENGPELSNILYSVHIDSVLKPMMHRSDNFFAEQMLLSTGKKLIDDFSEQKILDTLSALLFTGFTQKPVWADGSGLSRYNLFSPANLVTILGRMREEFGMERLRDIFPTGGTGTLSAYYKGEGDYIFAKTGTLNGVVALSGFLYTGNNRLLIFSVLVNHHNTSASQIRKGIESFLENVRKIAK